jgi:hypothetical protein
VDDSVPTYHFIRRSIAQQWLNGDHHGNNFNQAELSSSTAPGFSSLRRVYIVA